MHPPQDDEAIAARFAPLFEPRTIAVIGASSKGGGRQNTLIRRLRDAGFAGEIYPIHPTADAIDGLPAYRSLAATPQPVDYANIAIPAEQVVGVLNAGAGRVRFAQVISSGFGEDGGGRGAAGMRCSPRRVAAASGCSGRTAWASIRPRGRVTFTEVDTYEQGAIGIVSQSGGLGVDIVRRGLGRGLRFSGVVTVGNCADVGCGDLLEFYLADPQTRVIGFYLEGARDGRHLFDLLQAARGRKTGRDPERRAHGRGRRRGGVAHRFAGRRLPRMDRARAADRLRPQPHAG